MVARQHALTHLWIMFRQLRLRRLFFLASYAELSAILQTDALEQLTAMAASFYVAIQGSSCLEVDCSACARYRPGLDPAC